MEYDLKTKHPSSQKSVMSIMFFDVRSTIHNEFFLQGQIISQQVYKEMLQVYALLSVWKETTVVAGQIMAASPMTMHPHTTLNIQQFLINKNIAILA